MERINRLKVVLAEKGKTNKWLAEQLGKDSSTISKWVTNQLYTLLCCILVFYSRIIFDR